ncbi:MAG: DUF1294 domain-containing protein [Anaerolineae bacterium]|nr:DUF1294 domain-containing protein [Anaerolineae bacterium]
MRQKLTYTILALVLAISLASSFQSRLTVNAYFTWIGAFTFVAWAFYGLDKNIAEFKRLKGWRVPEFTLHILALLGGFPGAWIGRTMFNHKTNVKQHPLILIILIVSTLLHVYMAIRIIYGPALMWWPPQNWFAFS